MKIRIPYNNTHMEAVIDDKRVSGMLTPAIHKYAPSLSQEALVQQALENPISSKRLCNLAKEKKNVLVITSDHTRPVPSSITLPLLLREIRLQNQFLLFKFKQYDWIKNIRGEHAFFEIVCEDMADTFIQTFSIYKSE